jgi:hypothetical protein
MAEKIEVLPPGTGMIRDMVGFQHQPLWFPISPLKIICVPGILGLRYLAPMLENGYDFLGIVSDTG